MFQPGTVLQDRYTILNALGQGGFSQTYEVDDNGTLKVLKVLVENYSKSVDLFRREANVLSQLHHPGIPHVDPDGYFSVQLDGADDLCHCLVMERIPGIDLRQWLSDRQNAPISSAQALDWLTQLVDILEQIHKRQFFHRDIKPSNIMLRPDGQLALIDFGAVREVTETYLHKCEEDLTRTHVYSRGYTPLEQMQGRAVPESDFFALGRTFVHLTTGRNPLEFPINPKTGQLLWRPQAPQIAMPLAELIDCLMAPFPGQRPQHLSDIRAALAEIRLQSDADGPSVGPVLAELLNQAPKNNTFVWDSMGNAPLLRRSSARNPELTQPPLDEGFYPDGSPGLEVEGDRPASNIPVALDATPDAPDAAPSQKRWPSWVSPVLVMTWSLIATGSILGLRFAGLLQGVELQTLDTLMRLRPAELPDDRLLIVALDDADIEFQNEADMMRQGSLSDEALAQLLERLNAHSPSVIGLDIYREEPTGSNGSTSDRPEDLSSQAYLQTYDNLVVVCSIGGGEKDYSPIRAPSTVPPEQLGFSDIPQDLDGHIRRQILGMTPAEHCNTDESLSYQLAARYLAQLDLDARIADQTLYLGHQPISRLERHTGFYHRDLGEGYTLPINYRQVSSIGTTVSLRDLLNGIPDADLSSLVEGRIVLIGTTARSFGDYHSTLFGELPGVMIQAHMVSQMTSAVLDDRPLFWALPLWGDGLWMMVWASLSGGLVWYRLFEQWNILGLLALMTGMGGLCYGVLLLGGWLPLIPTAIAIIATVSGLGYAKRFFPKIIGQSTDFGRQKI